MIRRIQKLAQKFALLTAITMIRFAPGYGMDERELNSGLSQASRNAIRSEYGAGESLTSYYAHYLRSLLHGDLGTSVFLQRPVVELLKERAPQTAKTVSLGLLTAWIAASGLALLTIRFPSRILGHSATALSGLLIALPTAVIALAFVFLRAPVFLGIALVTFPKLFRYQQNLLAQAQAQPFVFAARARGLTSNRILFRYVVPWVWPTLVALLGVSSSMAFGAAIPLEALSDSSGMGQLAWQAALNRDLPLLTSITLVVTLVTVGVNFAADATHKRRLG
jgi:peptide/nickel transport system permease protein